MVGKPVIINAGVEPTPANPHSHLPLLGDAPGEAGPGGIRTCYGVLRPEYRGHLNSLASFARAKLTVAAVPGTPAWTITAHRAEVLLPAHADDRLLDPRVLCEAAETEHPPTGEALATYVTLTWTPARLHLQYEVGRAIARWLTDEFGVAVLLVQHVPARNGGTAQPHIHLIVPGPRRIMPWGGFGDYVKPLCRDGGRQLVVDRLAGLVEETAS